MQTSVFLTGLWATDNPVLPSHMAMLVAQHIGWALVLGCATLLIAARLARPLRLGLSVGVMLWALIPGSASPTYWLSLSFQAPSLMSSVLGLMVYGSLARNEATPSLASLGLKFRGLKMLLSLGVGLGWVLLLDTLAYLPQSVYGWGFGTAALGVVALLMALVWGRLGSLQAGGLLGLVLVLFVATRLPSGNLWDALIDPWLWIALQAGWLISVLRRRQAQRPSLPATPV
jgi:hypothetical protein